MPQPTANEQLRDAVIRHQIGLLRLADNIRDKVIALLNDTERDLRDVLERKLEALIGKDLTKSVTVDRLNVLFRTIGEIRSAATDAAYNVWQTDFKDLTKAEVAFINTAVKTTSPVVLDLAIPEASKLTTLVTKKPFEGRVLKAWAKDMEAADLKRIQDQITVGIVQGETVDQITRRVLGTGVYQGTDGIVEITRQNAQAITRTAVNFYSNAAKAEYYQANKDIFDKELFVATLDSRTTPLCRSLDGKVFPVGVGPRPPLHFNCRSVRVAYFDDVELGDRPNKPFTENQLVREYAKENGLDAKNRDELPHGTKGAFDKYASKRTRELTGQVPGATNYQSWLKSQSAHFQDEVLGATRGKLFRNGDLKLERFVNPAGRTYTLDELARRDREAFIKAGLDPDAY